MFMSFMSFFPRPFIYLFTNLSGVLFIYSKKSCNHLPNMQYRKFLFLDVFLLRMKMVFKNLTVAPVF